MRSSDDGASARRTSLFLGAALLGSACLQASGQIELENKPSYWSAVVFGENVLVVNAEKQPWQLISKTGPEASEAIFLGPDNTVGLLIPAHHEQVSVWSFSSLNLGTRDRSFVPESQMCEFQLTVGGTADCPCEGEIRFSSMLLNKNESCPLSLIRTTTRSYERMTDDWREVPLAPAECDVIVRRVALSHDAICDFEIR